MAVGNGAAQLLNTDSTECGTSAACRGMHSGGTRRQPWKVLQAVRLYARRSTARFGAGRVRVNSSQCTRHRHATRRVKSSQVSDAHNEDRAHLRVRSVPVEHCHTRRREASRHLISSRLRARVISGAAPRSRGAPSMRTFDGKSSKSAPLLGADASVACDTAVDEQPTDGDTAVTPLHPLPMLVLKVHAEGHRTNSMKVAVRRRPRWCTRQVALE
jgi:hypothetical protein